MDSSEIALDLPPFLRIFKDGRVERILGNLTVPASLDPITGVESKDVVISPENDITVRLYLPNKTTPSKKLPLVIYFHGGGFCIETASSPTYHNYLNTLVAQANVVVVSVNYRRAPEHPVPAAYKDSWFSLQWVASHMSCDGPEAWLTDHADFGRVFMAGDSAGANIAHNMALRAGSQEQLGLKFEGIILVHPYFWGKDPIGNESNNMITKETIDKLWLFVCPGTSGLDDPLINPVVEWEKLRSLGCTRVLICVAEKDGLRDRNWAYYEALKKSGWNGEVEIQEIKEEDHVFHLFNPTCDNAHVMMKKLVSFINKD